ncbi:MAG: helix-turn-helix transcriptional regulator [Victivallales bacterium]
MKRNIEIVRLKDGYNFKKAIEEAKHHSPYYEEKLLLDVADKIIAEMESDDISRVELAKRLGVSPAYITKVLRGHANLTIESLAKIAFALGKKWECSMVDVKEKKNLYFHPHTNRKTAIAEKKASY